MGDNLTKEQRHKNMSHIRSKDTKPEMIVRKYLFSRGLRYRLHVAALPGKPDLVFSKSLLNNALAISGMTCSSGTVNIPSTAHPVLLIENLTCVTMMLNAMLEKADDPKLRDGLMLTVGHIWNQLTDYARKRVVEATIKWYGEDSEAVARLRNLTTTADRLQFVPETKAFSSVEGQLMYYMKTETRCLLEYEKESSMLFCMGVPHVNLDDANSIYIQTDNGEKVSIPFIAIRSCKIEAQLQ